MLRLISLLLPALIPSWRFFKTVAPSPRIEYRVLRKEQAREGAREGARDGLVDWKEGWQEDRPRPTHLSLGQSLWRMLWNPDWNEQLFMVSCAERLIEDPSQHSIDEINSRVARLLPTWDGLLQFRLVFLSREGSCVVKIVEYESTAVPLRSLQEGRS